MPEAFELFVAPARLHDAGGDLPSVRVITGVNSSLSFGLVGPQVRRLLTLTGVRLKAKSCLTTLKFNARCARTR